jgi:hypothetical protein
MTETTTKLYTCFEGLRLRVAGPLREVALAVKAELDGGSPGPFLVFDDATGRVIDLELRGTQADVVERLSHPPQGFVGRFRPPSLDAAVEQNENPELRGRGRPKLGVVAREVTLLPRHWEWLAAQPSGASAVLRKLVDEARKNTEAHTNRRAKQEAAYQFMAAMAGDLPGYEESLRALFAGDLAKLARQIEAWPTDIRAYVLRLASA